MQSAWGTWEHAFGGRDYADEHLQPLRGATELLAMTAGPVFQCKVDSFVGIGRLTWSTARVTFAWPQPSELVPTSSIRSPSYTVVSLVAEKC